MTDPHTQKDAGEEKLVTGFWTGVFDTEDMTFDPTPFHAFIHEEGGILTGEAVEPNGFSADPIPELFASLEGWRDAEEIEFVKTYEAALGAGFSVRFEGAVDLGARRIRGVWSILDTETVTPGLALSGPFVMNKTPAQIQPSVAAPAERRRGL